MKSKTFLPQLVVLALIIVAATGCGGATTEPPAIPTTVPSPAITLPPGPGAGSYVPVTPEICLILQGQATQAIPTAFEMKTDTPFTDPVTGEMGQACTLTATGTGTDFSDPQSAMSRLISAMLGWTEQTSYQADGPTGTATALTRDRALMLLEVSWAPSPEAECPADQPISACDLQPEQKLYTIRIQTATK